MADLSQITVGDITYDITDDSAHTALGLKSDLSSDAHHTYYVKGTQVASTGAWTGNLPDVDALYEGLSIDYWLPFAGSGNATLNLTLKDGSVTGPIPVYYGSTTVVTSTQPVNTIWRYIYQTVTISNTDYTGWWAVRAYFQNTTDIVNLYEGAAAYQADSVVYRYQLLFQMADPNKLTPLNNNNNATGTSKTMLTNVEFDPFGKIYFYNSTTTVIADGNMTTSLYYHRSAFNLQYTFNCGSTLTANKDLYLVVSLQSNGMVKLASSTPWAQDLPLTNDGYLYIFLGRTSSTYQAALYSEHPVYYHDGTGIRRLYNIGDATTLFSGLMSASDKAKLDGIEANANNYSLPEASSSQLGGVKVGNSLSIANGVLDVAGGGSGSGLQWNLLWTNPSPSANFAAQTITLDLSSYTEVRIAFTSLTTTSTYYYRDAFIGAGQTNVQAISAFTGSSALRVNSRNFEPTVSGVVFDVGYQKLTNATSASSSTDNSMIPQKIWTR